MHYLVVAGEVLAELVITLADLISWLEHGLVVEVEPDNNG